MSVKGWCPSLFAPMQSGDGWLVRVQPRRAILSADDARIVADAAALHGNAMLELTNRGNLQIRGLSPTSAETFATTLAAAGLAERHGGPDLLVSPLTGDDPGVHPQTAGIADALEAADFGKLADKFLIVVDGGGAAGLHDSRADIAVRAHDGQWAIWIDGEKLGAACDPAALRDGVLRLVRAFAAQAKGAWRMRDLVRSAGSLCVFKAAGLVAELAQPPKDRADPIGRLLYHDNRGGHGNRGGFGLGMPGGPMKAESLSRLAMLAERFGDGTLRTTPWRCVILTGVTSANAASLRDAANEWITDPQDPRRAIIACTGQPRCTAATVDTRADAAFLAREIARANPSFPHPAGRGGDEGQAAPSRPRIHVSGCAKGCAHPGPAPITLVGDNGAYNVIRNGKASDAPDETGLTLREAARILAAAA